MHTHFASFNTVIFAFHIDLLIQFVINKVFVQITTVYSEVFIYICSAFDDKFAQIQINSINLLLKLNFITLIKIFM